MSNLMSDEIRKILHEAEGENRSHREQGCSEAGEISRLVSRMQKSDTVEDTLGTTDEPCSSADSDQEAIEIYREQALLFPRAADCLKPPDTNTKATSKTNNPSYYYKPVTIYNITCSDADTVRRIGGDSEPDLTARCWSVVRLLGTLYSYFPPLHFLVLLAAGALGVFCLGQIGPFLKYFWLSSVWLRSNLLSFRTGTGASASDIPAVIMIPTATPVFISVAPFMHSSTGVKKASVDLCNAVAAMHASTESWTILGNIDIDDAALHLATTEDMKPRIGKLVPRLDEIHGRLTAILSEQAKTQARLINSYQRSPISRSVSWGQGVCRWVHFVGLCTPQPTPREKMLARWQTLGKTLGEVIQQLTKVYAILSPNDEDSDDDSLTDEITKVVQGMAEIDEKANFVVEQVYHTSGDATVKEHVQNMVAPVSAYSQLLQEVFEHVDHGSKDMASYLKEYIEALRMVNEQVEKHMSEPDQPDGEGVGDLSAQMGETLAEWVKLSEILDVGSTTR
ncbi:hypothetical protein G7Z17_g3339 [Cylindrodendrum hubeiense]|uniref:Uncharacterized protein n=1 Tax=Cylindrodendrum hubeiense TaxID=595255 RepID=A0A9P5HG16_9HYPO|nr:hypothetical protein G7Z17_g3339 [Cylindrodendrum hubeiense]